MLTDVSRAAGSVAGQKAIKTVPNSTRRRVLSKVLASREPDKESYRPSEVVTFFTSDGLVQLPKWQAPSKAIKMRQNNPLPTWQEQGLCIGNTFWVTATNGHDLYRRLNLIGYCRCTELLSDVVEHTVLSSGGEIVIREHKTTRSASLGPYTVYILHDKQPVWCCKADGVAMLLVNVPAHWLPRAQDKVRAAPVQRQLLAAVLLLRVLESAQYTC